VPCVPEYKHMPISTAKFNNAWKSISTFSYIFRVWGLIKEWDCLGIGSAFIDKIRTAVPVCELGQVNYANRVSYLVKNQLRGFQVFEALRFHDRKHMRVVKMSAVRTGRL